MAWQLWSRQPGWPLADPAFAPIFFVDPFLKDHVELRAICTVIDSLHIERHLSKARSRTEIHLGSGWESLGNVTCPLPLPETPFTATLTLTLWPRWSLKAASTKRWSRLWPLMSSCSTLAIHNVFDACLEAHAAGHVHADMATESTIAINLSVSQFAGNHIAFVHFDGRPVIVANKLHGSGSA